MTFKLFIPFFALALFLAGCREDHYIKVEPAGSAEVSYNLYFSNKDTLTADGTDSTDLTATRDSLYEIFNSFYTSPLISNYECHINTELDVAVKYRISDVNRLGEFLSPFLNIPVIFKQTKDSFTIDAGTGNADPEDDIGGYTNMLAFKMTLEFPSKIEKIENSSGLPVSYNDNKLTVESNLGTLNYSGKRNLIVVKYQ